MARVSWPAVDVESGWWPAVVVVGLQPVEMALRVAVFALPFFLTLDFTRPEARAALVVASLALCFYYAAWYRYFTNGREIHFLFNSWLGVPVPLAVAPIVYLAAASVLTRSVLLGIVTCAFGIVHILVSVMMSRTS